MKLNQAPNWRWQRARELVDKKLSPRRTRDDRHIVRAYKYLRRFRKDNPRIEEDLATNYPRVHKAKLLYEDIYSGTRWVFEAGVMAGQTTSYMAEYLNSEADVLQMYEYLFFDVRDALKHKGCIVSNVLMPMFKGGAKPKDPDFAWKLIAYEGGWEVVRSLWEIGEVSPVAIDFLNRTFREQILRTAREAIYSVVPNSFNTEGLVRAGLDMIRFEHEAGASKTRDQSQASIGALLGSIKLNVERSRAELPAEEPRYNLPDASVIFMKPVEVDVEASPPDEEKK
jgi:hypothetical protein